MVSSKTKMQIKIKPMLMMKMMMMMMMIKTSTMMSKRTKMYIFKGNKISRIKIKRTI